MRIGFEGDHFIVVSDRKTGAPICGNAGASLIESPPRDGDTEVFKRCDDTIAQRWLCCVDGVPKALAFDAGQARRFCERHTILLVDLLVEVVPLRRAPGQSAAAVDGAGDYAVENDESGGAAVGTHADSPTTE